MKKYIRDYAFLFGLAGILVLIDQWTKMLVRQHLAYGQSWSPWEWLEPYARIVHWQNTGAAFGMLQGFGMVFAILAVIVSMAIIYFFPSVPRTDWTLRLAMGMQLGGALGNLIDRIRVGQVTDFISVGTFPVFNVADASITLGVGVLLLGLWLKDREEKRNLQKMAEEEAEEAVYPPGHYDLKRESLPEGDVRE